MSAAPPTRTHRRSAIASASDLPFKGGGGRRDAFVALLFALSLFFCTAALAQTTVVPGNADRAARGAQAAKGAVIWNHGLALVAETPSDPPFYLDYLQDSGWDVFRLQRRWAGDNTADSTKALVDFAAKLRADGYERVVLAGQSFGAWISFAAARTDVRIDAILAGAPARYGTEAISANWRLNGENLFALARDIRPTRVMTFLFDKDPFDPGGRGPALESILKDRRIPYVIVDRPEGIEGHGSAMTHAFAKLYGPCIVAFVEIATVPDGFSCKDHPQGVPEKGFALPQLKLNPAPRQAAAGFAGFAGRWYGWAPWGAEVMLVVHELGIDRTMSVFAWTPKFPGERPGLAHRRGEYDSATQMLIFPEPRQPRIEAKLRPDGRLDFDLWGIGASEKLARMVLRKLD